MCSSRAFSDPFYVTFSRDLLVLVLSKKIVFDLILVVRLFTRIKDDDDRYVKSRKSHKDT